MVMASFFFVVFLLSFGYAMFSMDRILGWMFIGVVAFLFSMAHADAAKK